MKLYFAAAGALLLGTSALAWAPDDATDPAWKDAGVKAAQQLKYAVNDELADTKQEPMAWADSALKAEPAAWTEDELAVQPASAAWIDDAAAKPTDKFDKPDDFKPAAKDEPVVATGVGGPIEPNALDLTPRPATHNYPPCDPGPGDDNCIQLYEPGVRTALASWNGPTGGLAGDNSATAMGGPYEPVEKPVIETADAAPIDKVDTADSAPVDKVETADAAPVEDAIVDPDPAFAGTGGPLAETGYPPCRSESDDRCIQLYERGVTGEGN